MLQSLPPEHNESTESLYFQVFNAAIKVQEIRKKNSGNPGNQRRLVDRMIVFLLAGVCALMFSPLQQEQRSGYTLCCAGSTSIAGKENSGSCVCSLVALVVLSGSSGNVVLS